MNTIIREANSDDFESIYSLICDLEDQQMDKESFKIIYSKNLGDPNIYYLVADKSNSVVGFISLHVQHILHHSKPTCELQELTINSDLRGIGIGGLLMKEVEIIARKLNLEEIELTTKIHRERAQEFYRNLGYIHTHNKFVKKLY
ncbi:MAG: GNAT family N-acetyltransferase [Bacteroidales bacterium]|nr:GNAT family N-acetyltransferase [Bacteroidales bacterium]